jgi:hypothetical protein
MNDNDQRIREIAYFIWEEEGRPEGQADRHWRAAQKIVESQDAERKNAEDEPLGKPAEYITPLTSLMRAPSSENSR